MRRILLATLMALVFGVFSMPALQAAPGNGWAIGSAVKSALPMKEVRWWRRRRRGCVWVHYWRSRRRLRCW
jgi:hypothetical protein